MSAAEILRTLLETTVAASIAIALALALRRPLRTLAGAGIAYAVWWIVPVAVLAALLPAARQTPDARAGAGLRRTGDATHARRHGLGPG